MAALMLFMYAFIHGVRMRRRPSPLPALIQVRLDCQLSSLLSVVVLPLLEQIERDVGRQGAMFTKQVATLKDEVCTHIRTYICMYSGWTRCGTTCCGVLLTGLTQSAAWPVDHCKGLCNSWWKGLAACCALHYGGRVWPLAVHCTISA